MLEIKVTVEAPELTRSLQGLILLLGQRPKTEPAQETKTEPAPVPAPTPAPVPTAQVPSPQPAPAPAVPTTTQTYTMEQLAVAATQLVDAGRREELIGLLGQYGVQALTALPKEQYGAFATTLRQMGAKV